MAQTPYEEDRTEYEQEEEYESGGRRSESEHGQSSSTEDDDWEDEEESSRDEEEEEEVGGEDEEQNEESNEESNPGVDSVLQGPGNSYQFTASQVAYLKTRLPQYREGTSKRRDQLVSQSAKNIISELYAITGKKQSREKKKLITRAVKSWFRGRVDNSQVKAKKSVWGGRYYGQLVFKRERTRIVQYLADIISRGDPIPNDLRRLIDHENEFLSGQSRQDSDDEHNEDVSRPQKQTREGFTKFQTAASMLWRKLTAREKQEYEDKANAWKEATPPPEQQRKAAEKFASKRLLQFSEGLLKEMNARLHILVAFENSKGKPVAFDFELSGGNAGARGQAFRDLYDAQLKEMGLLELWKDFAADVFLDPLEQEEEARGRRMAKKSLMNFKRNEFGEPIIPSIRDKPGTEKRSIWLTNFLRSYLTIHYNITRGDPGGRTPVPWKRLGLNVRRFISPRFLPDHLAELLQEPSLMSSGDREKLYKFWRKRQNNPEVDNVFEFKRYWDRKSKTYKPRHNREKASANGQHDDDDQDERDDIEDWRPEDVQPVAPKAPAKKPSAKKKTKKRKDTRAVEESDEDSGWDNLDSDWGASYQPVTSQGPSRRTPGSNSGEEAESPWDDIDSDWAINKGGEHPSSSQRRRSSVSPPPPDEQEHSPQQVQDDEPSRPVTPSSGTRRGLSIRAEDRRPEDREGLSTVEESEEEESDELPTVYQDQPSRTKRRAPLQPAEQVPLRRSTRPPKTRRMVDFIDIGTPVTRSRGGVEDSGKRITRSAAKKAGGTSRGNASNAALAGNKRKSREDNTDGPASKKRRENTGVTKVTPARRPAVSQTTKAKNANAKPKSRAGRR
ncbi:hypothetical protein CC1G_07254 [Coprinopsis cinerea okayama7|uniref:Uncharacterized protein n=1 Tax=Coprinopsis cinerea (strain Okayama-7 / 130 / ATCC MYA-4618 / FGSC 9003) TaxID=240176 RepID=A8PD40_COPC7|nr:hypothetical protein CC1G_07254 [Coprinopsis cinerea okayama7\|eukprot:XP_001840524.1 hypothetical protein CC1G_07254 [Coprinopsis cinerea okayama7\